MRIPPLLAVLSTASFALAATKSPSKDAILLSNVKTLTLHRNRQTSHRRIPAVPQISCAGGTAAGLFEPDVIRCANQGYDYDPESIQWTCTASLPPEFKLGSTEVICEGYRNSADDWVLKGSCGVEYRLELTPVGEEKWPDRISGAWGAGWGPKGDSDGWTGEGAFGGSSESRIPALLFWCVFVGIAGWIVWGAFIRDSDWWTGGRGPRLGNGAGNRRPPGGGGGGGGGGWWPGGGGGGGGWPGDDSDPPPPYSRHDGHGKPSGSNANPNARVWQPGFWTGAAGGAAAAYLANNLSGRNNNDRSGGTFNRGYDAGVGPSNSRSGRSRPEPSNSFSSSPNYSSSRYESSGFGGTSRR